MLVSEEWATHTWWLCVLVINCGLDINIKLTGNLSLLTFWWHELSRRYSRRNKFRIIFNVEKERRSAPQYLLSEYWVANIPVKCRWQSQISQVELPHNHHGLQTRVVVTVTGGGGNIFSLQRQVCSFCSLTFIFLLGCSTDTLSQQHLYLLTLLFQG